MGQNLPAVRGPYRKTRIRDRAADRLVTRMLNQYPAWASAPVGLVKRYCRLSMLTSEIDLRLRTRPSGFMKPGSDDEPSALLNQYRQLVLAENALVRTLSAFGSDKHEIVLSSDAVRRIEAIHRQQQEHHADSEADDE